jgi:hypothetical protein
VCDEQDEGRKKDWMLKSLKDLGGLGAAVGIVNRFAFEMVVNTNPIVMPDLD